MTAEIRVKMGHRLAAERERLTLTQAAFAKLGGAKTRTLQDWERGVATPSAEFLAAVGSCGVDLLFVLSGRRTPVQTGALAAEEAELLNHYRASDPEGRAAARKVLSALAQNKPA